ncbi:RICIN domain-containing protein [Nocardia fluminea]|uniref:RICIN domain-containing protein n=1 Tax=Nocardia fluminea TaxID=134984 RepID=UPI0034338EEF
MDFPEGSFFISNVASGLVLDVKGASKQPGTAITFEDRKPSGATSSQLWKYDSGFLVNTNSGLVLEVESYEGGGQISPGTALVQTERRQQPHSLNQLWAYNYQHLMPYDPRVCIQGKDGQADPAGTAAVADTLRMNEPTQQWMFKPQ